MEEKKRPEFPALTIEGVFLGANIAFLLAGKVSWHIITSLTLLLCLFTIQAASNNARFLFLFPVDKGKSDPIAGLDTLILKVLIVSSIFFFYWGATSRFLLALLILLAGLASPFIWDRYLEKYNQRTIARMRVRREPPTT
jgi:hypothetical protein